MNISIPRELNRSDSLETYPAWSPDGRNLFFCRAPRLWTDTVNAPPVNYDKVRYDLVRVSYDAASGRWGKAQVVLSAAQTGKSMLLPRVSPDGRFLLFCMADYGCFPVFLPSSDLYVVDLAEAEKTNVFAYKKLEVNTPFSESWHTWSSNSRWIVFSSKREGGLLTRLFISRIDAAGHASKPFILPQKDPDFYGSFLETFSLPELVKVPVTVHEREFGRALRKGRTPHIVSASGNANAH